MLLRGIKRHFVILQKKSMRHFRYIFAVLAVAAGCFYAEAVTLRDDITMESFVYAVKDADTLRLDRYTPAEIEPGATPRPVVLYAFGGGFKGGVRYSPEYLDFFYALVDDGFTVVSADYRTLLGRSGVNIVDAQSFVDALNLAVSAAVEDLYDATSYVVSQSAGWDTDSTRIVACGSSAGAITVLQAEYGLCAGLGEAAGLPDDFNYAAVVAFAGAVCAPAEPEWLQPPCPMMLFHGDADTIVPYDRAVTPGIGLYGSASISASLDDNDIPHYFYTVRGAGHEINQTPMQQYIPEVLTFLRKEVVRHCGHSVKTVEYIPGRDDYKRDFTVEDYIRANF